ncbi:MAG: 50S ribosomal protein L11 methyltransferase [Nitrososphaerales archaeon]
MDWIEISVAADGEAAEAVSELFNRLNSRPDGQGGAVTEVGGWDPVGEDHHPFVIVKTYLPSGELATPGIQRQIEEGLWFLGRVHPLGEPQIRPLKEEDWANAWKANYKPLRVGRFYIIPSWEQGEVAAPSDALPVILDPGMAFGTGLHPSTQLCLLGMDGVVGPGVRVLDAGCGSGILSIAAARLGATEIDGFDIDPIAVRATAENASLNQLPVSINVVTGAGPDNSAFWATPGGKPRMWDVLLVNILPHVITALLDQGLANHLAPGGKMILAGIIEEREPDLRAYLEGKGLKVTRRRTQGDWVSLTVELR